MPEHTGHHAWNTGDRLEKDESDEPLGLCQRFFCHHSSGGVLLIRLLRSAHARCLVHTPSAGPYQRPCDVVPPCLRLAVPGDDSEHFGVCVAMMRPCRGRGADVSGLFGGEEVTEACGGCGVEATAAILLVGCV